MPKMSMTMTEGILVSWRRAEGDAVSVGDVICEVTTDKVDMDVESPVDGTVARLLARPDDVVPVGTPIAFLLSDAEDLLDTDTDPDPDSERDSDPDSDRGTEGSSPTGAEPGADLKPDGQPEAADQPGPQPAGASPAWIPAMPLARRIARERGLDLSTVTGTGPNGVVRVGDLRGQPDPRAHRRTTLARTMTASLAVPQCVAYRELDVTALSAGRGGISWTTLLVHAFAGALRGDRLLNVIYDPVKAGPIPLDHVVVAVAVDTPRGPLAPVLPDPDLHSVDQLHTKLRGLINRARRGRLLATDLAAGTTLLANLGGRGVDSFSTMLTQPHATALTVGAVATKPVVGPDGLTARQRCIVGLVVDCRVADGADAARLLGELARRLATPDELGLARPTGSAAH